MRGFIMLLTAFAGAPGAHAGVTLDFIGDGVTASGVSADGSVIVGNTADGAYETFRWTEAEGVVLLGGATVPVLGTGAGIPDVSDDGLRISATILSEDMKAIAGVWHDGFWEEGFPLPPDGGMLDSSYSSAWGISGDGVTMIGLYWRPGAVGGGSAHAMQWTSAGGTQSLIGAPSMRSSRANGANSDGSVIAGWEEHTSGAWQPTVWVNGVKTVLHPGSNDKGFAEAWAVSSDGSTVVGDSWSMTRNAPVATRWVFEGGSWVEHSLGVLPGTAVQIGRSFADAASGDGSVIVGTNYFVFNGPFSTTTGFMWTENTGMVDIRDFLSANGITLDPDFQIDGLTDISPDARTIIGFGHLATAPFPFPYQSFRIRIVPDCPADLNGDGFVGTSDLALLLGSWGQMDTPADLDGGGVNASDLALLLGGWGACP